jgi:hypothetical protein
MIAINSDGTTHSVLYTSCSTASAYAFSTANGAGGDSFDLHVGSLAWITASLGVSADLPTIYWK